MTSALALPKIALDMLEQHQLPPGLYYLAVFGSAIVTHHAVEVAARRFIMQRAQHARSA